MSIVGKLAGPSVVFADDDDVDGSQTTAQHDGRPAVASARDRYGRVSATATVATATLLPAINGDAGTLLDRHHPRRQENMFAAVVTSVTRWRVAITGRTSMVSDNDNLKKKNAGRYTVGGRSERARARPAHATADDGDADDGARTVSAVVTTTTARGTLRARVRLRR